MTKDNTRALNGNKNFGGTGNGALYAAVTSAPATTMEWRPEMERDVKVQQPVWHSGMENEIVVSQLDGRRHSLDGDHDKLADDILKIFDDVMNNRDTDNGELGFAERIASRISDMMKTAGITSFAQAAIMMVAERESKTKNKDLWSEIVERLTEEGERKDRKSNILNDAAMDVRALKRQREQEELEERQEQLRKERAEVWRSSEHTYAGQKMTGQEWLLMIDWFKSPENRAAWEDAMIDGTGQSRDEVRETAAKMARFDELMKKKANGEVLTPQEQAEFNRLDRDEEVRRGIETRRRIQQHQMDQTPESASKYSNLDGSISDGVESRNLVYSDGGQAGNLIRQTNSVASEVTNDGNSLPRGTTSMAFNAQSGAAQSNSQNVVELSAAQPQQPVAANGVQRVASVAITFDSAMM